MGFWAKSRLIFNFFHDHAKASIRQIAVETGLSKSSVHRLQQAMERRDVHPESWLWETAEGRSWLVRLVVASLYIFGFKRGVGADTISEFLRRLRLEAHVGSSPSALRGLMEVLEPVLLETAAAWEREGIAAGELRPIIGAVDETFLERMMLVFMDLASGYLLVEEVAADRSYDTWYAVVKARLAILGTGVRYLVSDRAKALIKLAEMGLACLSIPDLFHLMHDLAKSYALAIFHRLRQAQQTLTQAQAHLAHCQASHREAAVQQAQALVEAHTAEVQRWQQVQSAYRNHLEHLSLIMHPWRLSASTPQTSHDVEGQMQAEVTALETLVDPHGLPLKKHALDKVRKQLAGVAALVDAWWQEVWHDVESQVSLTPECRRWIATLLLPLMSWQAQLAHTRCPRRKAKLLGVLQAVAEVFETHPLTQQLAPDVLSGWQRWAAEHARGFQRASSAVEGRNGSLSQLHHNQRGLPKRRYKVWTVLHNHFDLPPIRERQEEPLAIRIKASHLAGRLEASFYNPLAKAAYDCIQQISCDVLFLGDPKLTREIRPITKFRKRVYVEEGGIPLLSSKQLFQIDPIDVKGLAKGAHLKDMPEIELKENMLAVTCSGTIGRVQIIPRYMAGWAANQHATRLIPSNDMNTGYLYAWLASDYGHCLMHRHAYGSVILEIDAEMLASVPVPVPTSSIQDEIGGLVLRANNLRHEAWEKEQAAIAQLEGLIHNILS
jgi:hypothetical protein